MLKNQNDREDVIMFTKDSALVKIWVGLVLDGVYTLDQVPQLSNLKEVVTAVYNEHINA